MVSLGSFESSHFWSYFTFWLYMSLMMSFSCFNVRTLYYVFPTVPDILLNFLLPWNMACAEPGGWFSRPALVRSSPLPCQIKVSSNFLFSISNVFICFLA